MKTLCETVAEQIFANFRNLETAIRTYDRNAPVCDVPAWRYVYHTLYSADRWFFNPFIYEEPVFHDAIPNNPDQPNTAILSDEELLDILKNVEQKTYDYLSKLTDQDLYERPPECTFTRMELILIQFRHMSFHTGMLNGQTVERTGKFPVYISPHTAERLERGLYDE
ncbi:MAG: DinB family protein [Firmicutes bacterium]|nr:DinB family protein [[Eubacterium] siraeum]MCM1488494.1 DinB family protein [Bacillota bacterium]